MVVADRDEAADRRAEGVARPGHVEAPVERDGHRHPGSPGELEAPAVDVGVDDVEFVLMGEDELHGPLERVARIVREAHRA